MTLRRKNGNQLGLATNLFIDTQYKTHEILTSLIKKAGAKLLPKLLEFFTALLNEIREPQTLEEIVAAYSHLTSQVILKAKHEERLTFVGGTFEISMADNEHVQLKMEAYFKNTQDQWVKKEAVALASISKFTKEALEEIHRERRIVYELLDPEVNATAPEV